MPTLLSPTQLSILTPAIVFTMGLPGAGKSTWVRNHLPNFTLLCADQIKMTHPNYQPHRPDILHVWSREVVDERFRQLIQSSAGQWVIEMTGSDFERMKNKIRAAKEAAFLTGLIYIDCDVEQALQGNQQRERRVPEHIVREKDARIRNNFSIVAAEIDYLVIISATWHEQKSQQTYTN